MRAFRILACILVLAGWPALAQVSSGPIDLSGAIQQAAPVKSVTGQTGDISQPTICGNASIPAGNTLSSTTENAFATTCTIAANTPKPGKAILLHVGGLYSAAAIQSARGRVRFTQNGTIAPASDTSIIDTGSVGGLAAASNQEWFGDVWITWQSGATSVDVQGALTFQSGNTSVVVPVGNTTTFSVDPTKDMLIYLTVAWGGTGNSMQLRTMVAK